MNDPLLSLADRVGDDPYFLASLLRLYAQSEQLDDAAIATALRCNPQELVMLRLCRAPRSDPQGFREDVLRIAERFGIEARPLAEIVRRGQALQQMRTRETAPNGSLLAARDRDSPSEGT